jgi:hypothetical protein
MKVEVLYFKGCPNHVLAVSRVRQALESVRMRAKILEVEVGTQAEAEGIHFLGSPSVRIDGLDIEPEARCIKAFGLGCRTYLEGSIRSGVPSIDLIRRALVEQIKPAMQHSRNRAFKMGLFALLAVIVIVGSELAGGQKSLATAQDLKLADASSRPSQLTGPILEQVKNIEDKMVTVAEDFPDDLYNTYRPKGNVDVRTAAEILLHVAGVNRRMGFVLSTKKQKDALFAAGKAPKSVTPLPYISKQDTVTQVKESFAAVRKAIEDNPDQENLEGWLYVIAHSNEHFGNLVTYYRDNGLVPPTSRQ